MARNLYIDYVTVESGDKNRCDSQNSMWAQLIPSEKKERVHVRSMQHAVGPVPYLFAASKEELVNTTLGLTSSVEGVIDFKVEVSGIEARCSRIPMLLWWRLMTLLTGCLLLHRLYQSIQRSNARRQKASARLLLVRIDFSSYVLPPY